MRLTKSQTALLNAREQRLLSAKAPWHVNDLATRIRQVRMLRDKQRDLIQRQEQRLAKAGKGRVGAMGIANQRTVEKEHLFDQALEHLQDELRQIDQDSSLACRELLDDDVPGRRANPQKTAKKTATTKTPATKTAATKSAAKKTASKADATRAVRKKSSA